jgi:hypothetical protein
MIGGSQYTGIVVFFVGKRNRPLFMGRFFIPMLSAGNRLDAGGKFFAGKSVIVRRT